MKIPFYILIGIEFLFLLACNEPIIPDTIISDNIKQTPISRSILTHDTLPDGSVALFNTQGSLNLQNQLLTLHNNRWESDSPIHWNNDIDTTYLTALYPSYNNLSYSYCSIYTDNLLTDILIAKDTIIGKKNIEISFKHLFSQLIINVAPSLQHTLEEIRLTVPMRINDISPKTSQLTFNPEPITSALLKNKSGKYKFTIPPLTNSILTLDLITTNQHYNCNLPVHTYERNMKYECNIRQSKGIQNAEDLIAFSHLINGLNYTGNKCLDDFMEIKGNDTIYFLAADIELSNNDCNKLLPIGAFTNYEFKYIFDGKNYTISNLTVPDKSVNPSIYTQYSGLFGCIDTCGIVQNLRIIDSQSVNSPTCSYTGIFCGNNKGKIINCSVSNSKITASTNSTRLGIICGCSEGYIVNCGTENCSIEISGNCSSGGIAGLASGYILNCYAYNNEFETAANANTGGIVGQSNTNIFLELSNCCVYFRTIPKNYFGCFIGYLRNAAINNICYNTGNVYFDGKNATIKNKHIYDSAFQQNNEHISTYLNEWIKETGNLTFPNFKFKEWSTEGLPRFK